MKVSPLYLMILLAVNILTIQGCAQVVHTEIQKGTLVKEQPSGKTVELERTPSLELLTPTTVKVLETVKFGQEFNQAFEKILVEEQVFLTGEHPTRQGIDCSTLWYRCRDSKNYDVKISENCSEFGRYCDSKVAKSVIKNEYVDEKSYKNITTKTTMLMLGSVSISVNGIRQEDITIGPDGIATIALEKYFNTFPKGVDIRIEFAYKSASAQSTVAYMDAAKSAAALLPLYRKKGVDNESAKDYIIAFKLSNDAADLDEAKKLASTVRDKEEIERLQFKYDEALDLSRFEQARQRGTLQRFISEYPDSKHIQKAKAIVEGDKFNEAWKHHRLKEYVRQNPNSEYVREATNIIVSDKLKDDILFMQKAKCNGAIVGLTQMPDIYYNGNHRGNCLPYSGEIVQMLSNNSALVSGDADDIEYVEFPKNFVGIDRGDSIAFYGLCKIRGFYKYTTTKGVKQTVLNLQLIREFSLDEAAIIYSIYPKFNALGTLTSP